MTKDDNVSVDDKRVGKLPEGLRIGHTIPTFISKENMELFAFVFLFTSVFAFTYLMFLLLKWW